jgi:hypothetical protein
MSQEVYYTKRISSSLLLLVISRLQKGRRKLPRAPYKRKAHNLFVIEDKNRKTQYYGTGEGNDMKG